MKNIRKVTSNINDDFAVSAVRGRCKRFVSSASKDLFCIRLTNDNDGKVIHVNIAKDPKTITVCPGNSIEK